MSLTVHYVQYGYTACLVNGPPNTWPGGHRWSADWTEVNCGACLAGRELIPTYSISADGKSFTCFACQRTSYNPEDVKNHYCGFCHAHHDDIWPPARKAWLEQAQSLIKRKETNDNTRP